MKKFVAIIAIVVVMLSICAFGETYSKGSKGEEVVKIQARLIELNYLSGKADGSYGGKTEAAVKVFQSATSLPSTGNVDENTYNALFDENAPKAKVYNKLNFKDISRNPDNYKGELYTFSGKVLQVMESEYAEGITEVDMRIATKGKYDNVVYASYLMRTGESRILEDDKVTIYGSCLGLMTYKSTTGKTISLPWFFVESVSFE